MHVDGIINGLKNISVTSSLYKESFAEDKFWNAHLSFAAMHVSRSISYTETPLQKKEQMCVWRVR
jgi:hypothetical protein